MSYKLESPKIKAYREILGVTRSSTLKEIQKAFHDRALLYHPDRNPDPRAKKQFERVREAYEVLQDELRVGDINKSYRETRTRQILVEGMNLHIGSFFGYRVYRPKNSPSADLKQITEKTGKRVGPKTKSVQRDLRSQEGRSILDDPSFDSIEVVYAGKMSDRDEKLLKTTTPGRNQNTLPWVLLNNQGLLHIIDGKIDRAYKDYLELNKRIPKNIIFLYRLALCEIVMGFEEQSGKVVLNKKSKYFRDAITHLRQAIRLGETRPVGKQRCLVVRKVLAELYGKLGYKIRAYFMWRDIRKKDPKSVEALAFIKGEKRAIEQLKLTSKK